MIGQEFLVVGVPTDAHSSFLSGPADAPPILRAALRSDATSLWTETGFDIGAPGVMTDEGDLDIPRGSDIAAVIEKRAADVFSEGRKTIFIGGDHFITFPIIKGLSDSTKTFTILHFDAHPDLYDELNGDRLSHACPFARIMEAGLAERLVQVGIRNVNGHQREQAMRFGVEMVEMKDFTGRLPIIDGPVYISFDLDALDPAFAPGVSHHEPGGLSTRQAIDLIHSISAPVLGADVVELNPSRDVSGITAAAGAKIVKEIAGVMLRNGAA